MDWVSGHGDYKVNSNSIVGSDNVPSFTGNGQGSMRVKHKEYIKDLVSSVTPGEFKIETFRVNPGNPQVFSWLTILAQAFQQYRMHGMLLEVRSMSGDALTSTNTALGTVIMGSQYDSYDLPWTSKQEMENTQFSSSTKPSNDLLHPIECQAFDVPTNCLYISRGQPVNGDIRLYDLCKTSVASQGFQGSAVSYAELWVTYDVELIKPQALEGGGGPSLSDHYWAGDGTTVNAVNPLGSIIQASTKNNLGTTISSGAGLNISIPDSFTGWLACYYIIDSTSNIGGAPIVPPNFSSGFASMLKQNVFDVNTNGNGLMGAQTVQGSLGSGVFQMGTCEFFKVVSGTGKFLTLSGANLAGFGGSKNADLFIMSISPL